MLKLRKIDRKYLPEYYPILKKKQTISTAAFCKEFSLFCNEYLKGAIHLHVKQLQVGALSVSTEYFAYFLKLLLKATAGIGAIDMYIDMRNVAAITFKFNTTSIDDDSTRRMFKIAMLAGFACARNEEVILLETAIHPSRYLEVCANNSLHLYDIFKQIILEEEPNLTSSY